MDKNREILLDIIRTALRRSTKALDATELIPQIEAAKLDLHSGGVSLISEGDALTREAIREYVVYHVEGDPRIGADYEKLKNTMAGYSRYRGDDDVPGQPC